nr:MAG TPA: hypothetical protein [Caudoviricetes sp.]
MADYYFLNSVFLGIEANFSNLSLPAIKLSTT